MSIKTGYLNKWENDQEEKQESFTKNSHVELQKLRELLNPLLKYSLAELQAEIARRKGANPIDNV